MPRAKTKAVVDKGLLSLFQEAMGGEDGRPQRIDIVAPKFDAISREAQRFVRAVQLMASSGLIREGLAIRGDDPSRLGLDELEALGEHLQDLYDKTFGSLPSLAEWYVCEDLYDWASIPVSTREAFLDGYAAKIRQENPLVQTAVTTCKNLTPYRRQLDTAGELDDTFLARSAGGRIAPIDGAPGFNLKGLYLALGGGAPETESDPAHENLSRARRMILMCAHKLYVVSHELYEKILIPDIDPDEFTRVITESIASVRRHIPRCDKAFDKILESTKILKGNFTTYYKDYAMSNDPTIILQNYVADVGRESGGGAEIRRQFRQIIGHYRKLAGKKAHDPRIKQLFGAVTGSFGAMAKADAAADKKEADAVSTGAGAGSATAAVASSARAAETPAAPTSSGAT